MSMDRKFWRYLTIIGCALCVAFFFACGDEKDDDGESVDICNAGDTESCSCPGGEDGVQICGDDGSMGSCVCIGEDVDLSGDHALGLLTINELNAEYSERNITVNGMFQADASDYETASACTETIDDQCERMLVPECAGGCDAGSSCAFDSSCEARCEPTCDLECGDGQECYFPAPGTPECREVGSFGAGQVSLTGATDPFSFNPPYSYAGPMGVTILPAGQATLGVEAEGSASEPGFAAFNFDYTSPARPTVSALPDASSFFNGDGGVTVEWNPGAAWTAVNISTTQGAIRCVGDDTDGSVSISRAALDEIVDDSLANANISLTRVGWHVESGVPLLSSEPDEEANTGEVDTNTGEDSANTGNNGTDDTNSTNTNSTNSNSTNADAGTNSTGLVAVRTNRSYQTMLLNCPGDQEPCGNQCVDVQIDSQNCGSCGNICDEGAVCQAGECFSPCNGDGDCNNGDRCDFESGQCVECLGEGDCDSGVCDDKQCVECLEGGDCDSGVCDDNQCVECTVDEECDAPRTCDTGTNTCTGCTTDEHCGDDYCDVDAAACVACLETEHCSVGDICTDDYECVECLSNADCPDGICEDNSCEAPTGDCTSDIDCAGDDVCYQDECTEPVPTTECYSHDDCIGDCDFYFGDYGTCECVPPSTDLCHAGQGCCTDGADSWCDTQCYE